eukprot:scaffold34702_cov147-Amphora_coffeaeformis.AAC.1
MIRLPACIHIQCKDKKSRGRCNSFDAIQLPLSVYKEVFAQTFPAWNVVVRMWVAVGCTNKKTSCEALSEIPDNNPNHHPGHRGHKVNFQFLLLDGWLVDAHVVSIMTVSEFAMQPVSQE